MASLTPEAMAGNSVTGLHSRWPGNRAGEPAGNVVPLDPPGPRAAPPLRPSVPHDARSDPTGRLAPGSAARISGGGDPIRVLLAARVRLYREGLREALARHSAIRLLGACATADDLLRVALGGGPPPQVVVLDLSLCRERPVAHELAALDPSVKILALAVDDRQMDGLIECASAGVTAWVGNDATVDELVRAIEHVARGELMCSPRQAAMLYGQMVELLGPIESAAGSAPLTPRERDVGALLAQGMSNKGISRTLGIGLATVKNHVHNILTKLEVSSRAEAGTRLARALAEPPDPR